MLGSERHTRPSKRVDRMNPAKKAVSCCTGSKAIGEYGFVAHFEDSKGSQVALCSTE